MTRINFAVSDWREGTYHILPTDFDLYNPIAVCGTKLSSKKWAATTKLGERHRMCLHCESKIIRPRNPR